ncbi:hypothetical protein WT83_16360 [Burkholderia territorii]|uniref:Uncharacterized protein n=1 Tax=Burkholderia territorii TaxID=1503055 RepID=A0A108EPF0_9BURK|nr:hypothetical protein WT83_16360 [Burkholderia territorii]
MDSVDQKGLEVVAETAAILGGVAAGRIETQALVEDVLDGAVLRAAEGARVRKPLPARRRRTCVGIYLR